MFYSKFSPQSDEHGRYYEPHVKNLYLQAMNEKGFKGISVKDVGLLISRKNSFLGASLGIFMERHMLPKLEYFYIRAVLPEFFTKRVRRGYKLYLHGGWC